MIIQVAELILSKKTMVLLVTSPISVRKCSVETNYQKIYFGPWFQKIHSLMDWSHDLEENIMLGRVSAAHIMTSGMWTERQEMDSNDEHLITHLQWCAFSSKVRLPRISQPPPVV